MANTVCTQTRRSASSLSIADAHKITKGTIPPHTGKARTAALLGCQFQVPDDRPSHAPDRVQQQIRAVQVDLAPLLCLTVLMHKMCTGLPGQDRMTAAL
jgi:hypothetical protein